MRRILYFSLLFQWIGFLAVISAGGLGTGDSGLLAASERLLTNPEGFALGQEWARMVITLIAVATLSVSLWAMILAVGDEAEARRDRILALAIAFSWTMIAGVLCMGGAVIGGAPELLLPLSAIQLSTLLTALAAGGVEFGLEGRLRSGTLMRAANDDAPRPAQMAISGERIARFVHSGRN